MSDTFISDDKEDRHQIVLRSATLLLTLWITTSEVCLTKPCPLAGYTFCEACEKPVPSVLMEMAWEFICDEQ